MFKTKVLEKIKTRIWFY